jgi:hypothetical protein
VRGLRLPRLILPHHRATVDDSDSTSRLALSNSPAPATRAGRRTAARALTQVAKRALDQQGAFCPQFPDSVCSSGVGSVLYEVHDGGRCNGAGMPGTLEPRRSSACP